MGLIHRSKAHEAGVEPKTSSGSETSPVDKERLEVDREDRQHAIIDDMSDPHTRLHRGLKARQVTMIAIGGAM